MAANINLSRPFESSVTEGEWGLGFGFGAKGKAGWGPLVGREGSQSLPVGALYKVGDGQADGTGAIGLKAAFEVSVPTSSFVVGEVRAGVQSPLNGVPAADTNFGGFYDTKIGEYKVAPTTQIGATFKVDLFNNSYKRAKP